MRKTINLCVQLGRKTKTLKMDYNDVKDFNGDYGNFTNIVVENVPEKEKNDLTRYMFNLIDIYEIKRENKKLQLDLSIF